MNPNWAFTPPPEHRRNPDVPAVRPLLITAVICALAVTITLGAVAVRSVRPIQAQPTPVLPLPTAPPPPVLPLPTAIPPPTGPLPTPTGPLPTVVP
ncbi:hypothetical protein [Mycolicibacterium thermoresistibile]